MSAQQPKKASIKRHNPFRDLRAAFILLTRIPLAWHRKSGPKFNRSVWAFPVVGLFVGGCGGLGYGGALLLGLPPMVAATLAIIIMVLISGAFHEDGLADVADGFGGGQSVERKLEIMRDSRIGAYGMLAIVFAIALRIGGLAALSASQALIALIIAAMFSRLMMAFVMRLMEPSRKDGLAHDTGKPPWSGLLIGAALCIGTAVYLTNPTIALYVTSVAILSTLLIGKLAQRQINGFTGDVLGAVQQISDIAVLLVLVGLWS